MARKRMIDPHIWETAYDEGWTPNELTVMVAAISAADDEGFGRISMIKRNVSEMFSDRKLKKILENLQDSIEIFDKIYFFLPNWSEYQKISHPKESKIKKLYAIKNNNLGQKSSGIIHGIDSNFGFTSEVKLIEVSLKEMKLTEEEITSSLFFEKCKNLYKDHTFIQDPNIKTHIGPIVQIWNSVPEDLSQDDVEDCIVKTFKFLDKSKGVKVSYLVDNILRKITAKHEDVLEKAKEIELKNAKIYRIEAKKEENEQSLKEERIRLAQYKEFYNKNPGLFTTKEKYDLVNFLKKNQVLNAGKIIEPKMEEMELG